MLCYSPHSTSLVLGVVFHDSLFGHNTQCSIHSPFLTWAKSPPKSAVPRGYFWFLLLLPQPSSSGTGKNSSVPAHQGLWNDPPTKTGGGPGEIRWGSWGLLIHSLPTLWYLRMLPPKEPSLLQEGNPFSSKTTLVLGMDVSPETIYSPPTREVLDLIKF